MGASVSKGGLLSSSWEQSTLDFFRTGWFDVFPSSSILRGYSSDWFDVGCFSSIDGAHIFRNMCHGF